MNRERAIKHLKEFIKLSKPYKTAIPYAHKNLQILEWEREALQEKPDEADEIPEPDLGALGSDRLNFAIKAFPLPPRIDEELFINSTSAMTTGSSDVFEFVTRVSDIGTPVAIEYTQKYVDRYQKMQKSQSLEEDISKLIDRFGGPSTSDRFSQAKRTVTEVEAGVGERASAANAIRNLIYGINGDLFKCAMQSEKENMTWALMVERLGKGTKCSLEFDSLIRQEKKQRQLVHRLSDVLKDREGGLLTNISYIWSEVLDHLYSVLTLLRFNI